MKIQCTIFLFLFFMHVIFIYADNKKELENQREALLFEIEQSDRILKKNKKSIENTLQSLNVINQQIVKKTYWANNLEKEIMALDTEIQLKEEEIEQFKKDLALKMQNYATSIQKMYQQKQWQDQWLFILSASDLIQSYHRILYWKEFGKWRKAQGEEILMQRDKIIAEKQLLKQNKKEKSRLVIIKKEEGKKLQIQEQIKKAEVENLKKDTQKLQSEVENKKKQAKSLEKEIKQTIQLEIANAKKAIQTKPKVKRKEETEGGYAMTKEEQSLSANFYANKGKLPFPLKGNYCIVCKFGEQSYEGITNIHYNNNGIDIKTTQNNTAKAVFDGIVSRIFFLPSYQSSVILRHGNYLTLYSYLEQAFVKQGEKIKVGQNIGKIYTDKEKDNSTILHFELWKEQIKLDPEPWLYR